MMKNIDWFQYSRFGMFIHWGVYASAGRGEWIKSQECIEEDSYQKYVDHFDPDLFLVTKWSIAARKAGMKYVIITAKHHDGFCLWNSKLTDYKFAEYDLLKKIVWAFREQGFGIGFYYSLIDWRHPEFTIDGLHPRRNDKPKTGEAQKNRDMSKYVEYLHGQVRELLTEFGPIDIMWFDFSYASRDWGWSKGKGKDDWLSEELLAMVRELQPEILVNDRLGIQGDFITPEQYQPATSFPQSDFLTTTELQPWEVCQTLNGSWGYDRDNLNWKSIEMLLSMLVDTVSKGGNLLLNVGPNARGELEARAIDRLQGIGEWMRLHNRSIYDCTSSKFPPPPNCRYTQRDNRLYLHLLTWPFNKIHLAELSEKVEYAQFLHDASEVFFTEESDVLSLQLPIQKPDVIIPVIELFLK